MAPSLPVLIVFRMVYFPSSPWGLEASTLVWCDLVLSPWLYSCSFGVPPFAGVGVPHFSRLELRASVRAFFFLRSCSSRGQPSPDCVTTR